MKSKKITVFWHRRDLRFTDNAGLYRALKAGGPVLPIFIFDRNILDKLPERADARVEFIRRSVAELAELYQHHGSDLRAYYGKPAEIWQQLTQDLDISAVFTNRDYEPYAIARDREVAELLDGERIEFHDFKDHVIFESEEVQKQAGGPYTVYTPYMRQWKRVLDTRKSKFEGEEISFYLKPYPTEKYADNLLMEAAPHPVPTLSDMGFEPTKVEIPSTEVSRELIRDYDKNRDFPAREGTSRLGIHFRHGTISIREKARRAMGLNETFLNELIWRDFYSNILQSFPHVVERSYRPAYDTIPWINDEEQFDRWCAGTTGVPIVDAGMRELNESGFMHNRVRMIVASYLTKHLLINWQWGESYFADKLLDYELASNNGGWQWAAGSGVDAQPYFRIFNYESQQKKFDKNYEYVKQWVPEYGTDSYPKEPLVEHKFGRERALRVYKEALDAARS